MRAAIREELDDLDLVAALGRLRRRDRVEIFAGNRLALRERAGAGKREEHCCCEYSQPT